MNKNIKKLISTIIITISIFTIVGCGSQSKETLKEEIKKEIKQEEVLGNTDEFTKDDLDKFESTYNEYEQSLVGIMNFTLKDTDDKYITKDKAKELKNKSDIIKEELIKLSPEIISETIKRYAELRDEFFNSNYENRKEDFSSKLGIETNDNKIAIETKIKELHTKLDNK